MMETRPRAVDDYVRHLERSLSGLPADRRQEIVADIEEHISALLAELDRAPSEADVRNVLERVGDPADIAAEAGGVDVAAGRPKWTDVAAVVLLPIPFVGWFAGGVLIWVSDVWDTRDKVIGTLAGPGMFVFGLFVTLIASSGATSGPSGTFEDSGGSALGAFEVLVLTSLFLVPLAAAIYLGRKLQRARAAA
jgi:uncharacterized membrane protein